MKESACLLKLHKEYINDFPNGWIENLQWDSDDKSKQSFITVKTKIDNFVEVVFIGLCRSILSGEYLLKSYDSIQKLCGILQNDYAIDSDNTLKNKSYILFRNTNREVFDVLQLYRFRIEIIRNKIKTIDNNYVINAFRRKTDDFSNILTILEKIIEVCFDEYEFSNNEDDIRKLILAKDFLKEKRVSCNNKIQEVIDIISKKIDFLLQKLSHFSSQQQITFLINFEEQSIKASSELEDTFLIYKYYKYFINPSIIDKKDIVAWQKKSYQKKAKVWEMVLLMRYYTKITKSKTQINNLADQFDEFYNSLLQRRRAYSLREFDQYALQTIKNYMHNCVFSALLSISDSYSEIKDYLKKIQEIQNETFINNYHPYQKAIEYMIENIRNSIKSNENIDIIKEKEEFLKEIACYFEKAYKWCKKYQFYPFQLMYNECLTRLTKDSLIVFSPSSFCRPIKYDELANKQIEYRTIINSISNEINLYSEQTKIYSLRDEINKSKKNYAEILGIFTTVVTFLVGAITIFTNVSSPQVSLLIKIEHIMLLGVILLLFVSAGYFFINDINKNSVRTINFWFFVIVVISSISILLLSLFTR